MRVNVSNTSDPVDSTYAPPCRVLINFRDASGDLVRNRGGFIISRTADVDPGHSTFLDLNFDQVPSPVGTNALNGRIQVRPVITVQLALPPPVELAPPCIPAFEVFNNLTGRTQFVVSSYPAIQHLTVVPTN